MTTETAIIYRIDRDDLIVSVNDGWRTFADANGAPGLAEKVDGRPMWDFVAGMEATLLWQEIVARARSGTVLSFPYRCDSPGQRRRLTMKVKPLEGDGVEFVSTVAGVESRDPQALLSSHYAEGMPIRSCSWCRRFDAGGFVEVEEAILRLGLLEQDLRPITHTICERCVNDVLATLEEEPSP